ncbi:MAG: PBP1A family penicillin-binding protein [Bacilli bacterium]|nr:PBP1A family penicillin-binding protein [Bacilli bacterium]
MKKLKKVVKIFIFCIVFFMFSYLGIYLIASITKKLDINTSNGYYLYDTKNTLINGTSDQWINLEDISQYLIDATIAIEDKNFYKHQGFDYLRIAKSLYINIVNGKTLQGASTITQQYAKNLFLEFDKTWERKIKEAWLTIQLESQYSKEEILEGYLNTINYGGVYGIENASYYYFNKSAADLTLAEASILAGIPKSPSNYSPILNYDNSKNRQKLVLNAMVNNQFITNEEMDKAYTTELIFHGYLENNNLKTLRYFQDSVMDELQTLDLPSSFLDTGGLKIYTTLDMEAQTILETAIDNNFTNEEMQLASIIMNPNNGEILALAGGKDYNTSQYNRALYAKRQVGSTLKPFLYYVALENGFTESTTFTSEETTFVFSNNQTYSPSNYNNKYGNKNISMAAAIAYSENIYAVKTHLFLGEETLVEMLKRVGITSELEAIPSLALGSEEITLIDMVNAYSTLASNGYKNNPHFIKKIEDSNGDILYEYKDNKEQVLNSSLVYITNEILTSTYNYNFIDYNYPTCYDLASKLTKKYSVKTGTTDTDHLIFGYNQDVVVGIWSGYDNNKPSQTSEGKQIKYMWSEIVENYTKDKENAWYDLPSNVVGVLVDPISGKVADENTKNPTMFYYIKGTEPTYKNDSLEDLIPTIKLEE